MAWWACEGRGAFGRQCAGTRVTRSGSLIAAWWLCRQRSARPAAVRARGRSARTVRWGRACARILRLAGKKATAPGQRDGEQHGPGRMPCRVGPEADGDQDGAGRHADERDEGQRQVGDPAAVYGLPLKVVGEEREQPRSDPPDHEQGRPATGASIRACDGTRRGRWPGSTLTPASANHTRDFALGQPYAAAHQGQRLSLILGRGGTS